MKTQKKKIGRNFHAINAHFRMSGAIKDRKKENNKYSCRKWKGKESV